MAGSKDSSLQAQAIGLYDRLAAGYQRWWAPVIRPAALRLLDLVEPIVAERPEALLLDLGSGTGLLSRGAVIRWPMIRALAIDPSSGMRAVGEREAAAMLDRAACARISWMAGVAEDLPVADGAVDVVVSSFTLQYLPNRLAALREAHRASGPGAMIAVVTWLEDDWTFAPWRELNALLPVYGIQRGPSMEMGIFRSLPSAAALLRRAGFSDVRATEGLVEYQWTVEDLFHCALESEERLLFESLAEPLRNRLAEGWHQRLERLTDEDLFYRDRVAYVTGRRPGR
jgi:SAM-dependent methyltransferase